jgi:hypothetical protein
METGPARSALIRGLRTAYSGELGAALAYLGHRHALPPGRDRGVIAKILKDELHHRQLLLAMLHDFGARPDPKGERRMGWIGRSIGFLCHIGGWFVPMYGAARLEASNIVEYEDLARLAWYAGRPAEVDTLLHLAEVEWDHELVLRSLCEDHWAWPFWPKWRVPAARESIRQRFEGFRTDLGQSTPNGLAVPGR